MSLNPGNSGGPIVDERGQLVGIVSRKASPRRGLEGIALLEPLRFVLTAVEHARRNVAERTPTYTDVDRVLARIAADFVRTSSERPIFEQTAIPTVEAAATNPPTPEAAMIVAAHAWNMHVALLERRRVRDVAELPEADSCARSASLVDRAPTRAPRRRRGPLPSRSVPLRALGARERRSQLRPPRRRSSLTRRVRQSGGMRLLHGRAASSCPASCKSVASSPNRAVN